jgi:cell division protein FtsB
MQRLESSQVKTRQIKNEMEYLEDERRKIIQEKETLMTEANQQSEQWRARYNEMTVKNEQVITNLSAAN